MTTNAPPAPAHDAEEPHLIIRPAAGWQAVDLREVWRFRDLLLTLAGRDVKLRYRQTVLGPAWVLLGPLLSAGVFSFIFGKVASLPSEGVPYFLFVFAGQLGWNAFASVLGKSSGSLVGNAQLVSKIYFPRLILPLSTVLSALIDFGVGLGVLALLMLAHGVTPSAGILLLPVWLFLLLALALSVGLFTSALTVTYRDVVYLTGPLTQLLMWLSPVAYAASAVPERFQALYYLNPLASLIQAFKWSLLGTQPPPWGHLLAAAVFTAALFAAGAFAFQKMEERFADVI